MVGRVKKNTGYVTWYGYRVYKVSGGGQQHPEPLDEIKGRGDGTLEGGELVHLEAINAMPVIGVVVPGDYKLLTKYP